MVLLMLFCVVLCLFCHYLPFATCLFHATMRFHMELLDELPMVGLMASIAFVFDCAHPWFATPQRGAKLVKGTLALNITFVAVYLATHAFSFFITAFTFDICTVALYGVTVRSRYPFLRRTVYRAICFISLARVFWEAENHLCAIMPVLWPLHNVWHMLSAAAAYDMVSIGYYIRLEKLGVRGVVPGDSGKVLPPHLPLVTRTLPPMAEIIQAEAEMVAATEQ